MSSWYVTALYSCNFLRTDQEMINRIFDMFWESEFVFSNEQEMNHFTDLVKKSKAARSFFTSSTPECHMLLLLQGHRSIIEKEKLETI